MSGCKLHREQFETYKAVVQLWPHMVPWTR
jgi:hypothetical protein